MSSAPERRKEKLHKIHFMARISLQALSNFFHKFLFSKFMAAFRTSKLNNYHCEWNIYVTQESQMDDKSFNGRQWHVFHRKLI